MNCLKILFCCLFNAFLHIIVLDILGLTFKHKIFIKNICLRVANFFLGEDHGVEEGPWDVTIPALIDDRPGFEKLNSGSVEGNNSKKV